MKKILLTLLLSSSTLFSATPIVNLLSGTNVLILSTNRPGGTGVDVQINIATPLGDTNLTAPLVLLVDGDSLASESQSYGWEWSQQLTNKYRQYSNLVNIAVPGSGVDTSVGHYTALAYPWRPRNGTNGIFWYHGLNNDAVASNYLTTILTVSNLFVTITNDGWKIGVIDLAPRWINHAGLDLEVNRVKINDWLEKSPMVSYLVQASKLVNNSNMFYGDFIHLREAGHYRLMNAVVEAIQKGPRQAAPSHYPVTLQYHDNLPVYADTTLAFNIRGSDGWAAFGTTNYYGQVTVSNTLATVGSAPNFMALGVNASLSLWDDAVSPVVGAHWTLNSTRNMMQRSYMSSTWTTNMVIDSTNHIVGIPYGTLYRTNVAANLPTAAYLGIGGFWIGNSNGVAVLLRSVDGSTTIMKVLE